MKSSRETRSADRRRAILDAAAHAIAQHGFHGMSMRELANKTGQSLAAFYNHFSSKDEVLFHIQKIAFETMIARAKDSLRGVRWPSERLFAFIHQHVRFVAEHPEVMRVLVHEAGTLPPKLRAQVRELKERYYDLGRVVMAELYGPSEDLELERTTYALFGMLNWIYGWYRPARHGSPWEVARTLHRLALGAREPALSMEGATP